MRARSLNVKLLSFVFSIGLLLKIRIKQKKTNQTTTRKIYMRQTGTKREGLNSNFFRHFETTRDQKEKMEIFSFPKNAKKKK